MSDSNYKIESFVMEFCGLENPIEIRILEVSIPNLTIKYSVRIPNAPGEMVKEASLKGILISQTVTNHQAWGTFKVLRVLKDEPVDLKDIRWNLVYASIYLSSLVLSQDTYDRLFPSATA